MTPRLRHRAGPHIAAATAPERTARPIRLQRSRPRASQARRAAKIKVKYTVVRKRVRTTPPTATPKSAAQRVERKPLPASATASATPWGQGGVQFSREPMAGAGPPPLGE